MPDPTWAPCPRCQSARVQYTKGATAAQRGGLLALSIAGALGFLVLGILLPCLWLGVPFSLGGLVWALMAPRQARGTCRDCRHTWLTPPPAPPESPSAP